MTNTKDLPRHAIRVAAHRSGITTDTLRAWERRHRVVAPARSDTARRLYSDADIEHLRLLRELTARGHSIGHIATLSVDELSALLTAERPGAARVSPAELAAEAAARADGERAFAAMDGQAMRRVIRRAMLDMTPDRVVEQVIAPLCRSIGEQWATGAICAAHEHIASVAMRDALGAMLDVLQPGAGSPRLVVATPAGERHELGALMSAVIAASAGWEVVYLGPDLPAADIGAVVTTLEARAVLLSVVRAADEAAVVREVRAIRALVPDEVPVVTGGAAAERMAQPLAAAGGRVVEDFTVLRALLADAARG